MSPSAAAAPPGPWHVEFDAFARAAGGAVLFGVPLLFTMEMWWIGGSLPIPHLLPFLALAFAVNVLFARMSGFRPDHGSLRTDIEEACGALAVAALVSAAVLLALGRIDSQSAPAAVLGMIAVQMIPLSLGASVASVVFKSGRADDDDGEDHDSDDDSAGSRSSSHPLLNDVAATIGGALFIGVTIAPTEEIPMLASGLNLWNVLGLVAFTLVAGYLVVFASGFDPEHRNGNGHGSSSSGIFQHPVSETVLATLVSFCIAAVMLVAFGQLDLRMPPHAILEYSLVLGVPAAIGGAAGRVVI